MTNSVTSAPCPHGRSSWASCPHCLGINGLNFGPHPGPCTGCGAEDYPLSAGGPSICPACDCTPPERRVKELAAENRRLRALLAGHAELAGAGVTLRQSVTTCQGRKVPALYRQVGDGPADDDPVIGLVGTPELAALIVAAVNACRPREGNNPPA